MPTTRRSKSLPARQPAEPSWHLLSDEDLFVERQKLLDRQHSFMKIAAAINATNDPDHVLRLVRDAVVESGMFERAGVWVMEGSDFRGAWGTDAQGALRDEHHIREGVEDWGPRIQLLLSGETSYLIKSWTPVAMDGRNLSDEVPHAIVALRAGSELLGVLSVDNLITLRPVMLEDVEALLPFADMASAALRTARMARERDRLRERHQRLNQLAAGMNASLELPQILRMVHDAVVETAGFDRAGVFMIDTAQMEAHEAWGTDRNGNAVDGSQNVLRKESDRSDSPLWRVVSGELPYYLTDDHTRDLNLTPDNNMYGVHAHAVVPMRTAGEIVGVICVDNVMSDRPIGEAEITDLVPFAEQAALAILNARLFQEVRTAQDALVGSEKLRALGELAGGVAHNINNLLTAVLGYAELIRQHPDHRDNVLRYAGIIERAGMDGAEIVRRVQQFAQQETVAETRQVDLGAVVREAVDLTRPYWNAQMELRGVDFSVKLSVEEDIPVSGTASELREVAVNLLRNAADAMPGGGEIFISCRRSDGEAVLEVADTGNGMDEAIRKRVFEPFFTTKGPALGLGLGLSMAWGIVTRHGGAIQVDSIPGAGSTFRVTLGLAGGQSSDNTIMELEPNLTGVRVLLVDDEPLVLDSLSRLLEHCGMVVHAVGCGEDALTWLAGNASSCDIVLTDHGMPDMTGLQLLNAVCDLYPMVRRALISGWGAYSPSEAELGPAELVLNKPITRDALVRKLAELVQARGGSSVAA